jgi:hypothetical protein
MVQSFVDGGPDLCDVDSLDRGPTSRVSDVQPPMKALESEDEPLQPIALHPCRSIRQTTGTVRFASSPARTFRTFRRIRSASKP